MIKRTALLFLIFPIFAAVGQGISTLLSYGTGPNSLIVGGLANTAGGQYSVTAGGFANGAVGQASAILGGQGNGVSGVGSATVGGFNSTDRGRYAMNCQGSGSVANNGDNQYCTTIIHTSTSGASIVRLTTDASAASSINCVNILPGMAYNVRIALHARNFAANGTDYDWSLPTGMLTQDSNAASTAWSAGTPVIITRGTVTGASVSASADTTNGCLNLSFTPPTGNAVAWHISARVETVEVQ